MAPTLEQIQKLKETRNFIVNDAGPDLREIRRALWKWTLIWIGHAVCAGILIGSVLTGDVWFYGELEVGFGVCNILLGAGAARLSGRFLEAAVAIVRAVRLVPAYDKKIEEMIAERNEEIHAAFRR